MSLKLSLGIRPGAAEFVPKTECEREKEGEVRLGLSEVAARQDVWPRPLRKKVGLETVGRRHGCNHLSQFVAMASKTTSHPKAKIMKKVPFSFALSRISSGIWAGPGPSFHGFPHCATSIFPPHNAS